ncbi:hypothetical protein CXB51_009201 [Gossypium anomalum]|uniref:DUF7745 domain-containing protein n=1 Tax=Gossypium anomalum TaxID=47600 RepID=A0A8J6D9T0_9ROSI|nr:hypothetical protein CXB51_009201 [Gossypium anomalum]
MRNEYLDKVEDNASICTWSEKTQLEKGDNVIEGYTSELWDFTRINSTQNEFQELRDIWAQWDDEAKRLFYQYYGDLPYFLDIKVDKHLFRAMVQFWNPAYSCFTFGEKLMMIIGMSEQWAAARIQQKGDGKCIPWASLRDLILAHPDVKRRVDVLALNIYGLVIFPKAIGHIDEAVADLFDRLGKPNTPKVDKVPCRVFFKDHSPLKETAATPRRDDITEESFDWVPLPEIWGVIDYTPLLVLRQYKTEQFIPAWKKVFCVKILTKGLTITFEYKGWFSKRVNDNIPRPSLEAARSIEENLRVIPSELEVIKQKFKMKNLELGRKIERLEEENMYLSLDVNIQKIELKKVVATRGSKRNNQSRVLEEEVSRDASAEPGLREEESMIKS